MGITEYLKGKAPSNFRYAAPEQRPRAHLLLGPLDAPMRRQQVICDNPFSAGNGPGWKSGVSSLQEGPLLGQSPSSKKGLCSGLLLARVPSLLFYSRVAPL